MVLARLQSMGPELEKEGTNVPALVSSVAVRVRDMGVSLSGLPVNLSINNKIGSHIFCEEMDLLSVLVETGRLNVSDWVSGIQILMRDAAQERYYLSYHWEEYACLSGLRRLLMRHAAALSHDEIADLRVVMASREKTFARNRVLANASVTWSWVQVLTRTSCNGLSQPLDFDCFWEEILIAYGLRHQVDARLEVMVDEWNRAESENRLPNFGRPGISLEESVTTIADAYAAIDLALAVEQYRRDNGELPTSLETLVPRYVGRVPVCMTDGTPFVYAKDVLDCLDEERLPAELKAYRQYDSNGDEIMTFSGYRVSFKYANPEKNGPFQFSVPVLDKGAM